jgi:hypothetical protein
MTAAELVVLLAFGVLVLWLLRPLQRRVRNLVERMMLRARHGKVIEGRFRPVNGGNDDPNRGGRPN